MIIHLQDTAEYPRLVFEHDVDENDLAPQGFRGDIRIEFPNGDSFPVYFYEPQAVQEELTARAKWGFGHFVSEPGLVIIPEITLSNIKTVVAELIEIGHFTHFRCSAK